MKRIRLLATILSIGLLFVAVTVQAQTKTNLRGKVVKISGSSKVQRAMPYKKVDLCKLNADGSKCRPTKSTHTDRNGMYYLSNIAPGRYRLDVTGGFSKTFTVKKPVKGKKYQDLPLVKL